MSAEQMDAMMLSTDFLQCVICLEFARNAMECLCCCNLACEECLKMLKKDECPSCRREPLKTRASQLARRMIGSLPQVCPNECGTTSTIGNMVDHLKKCANRTFQCGMDGCQFEGRKKNFLDHLVGEHELKLIEKFDKNVKADEEEKKTTGHMKGGAASFIFGNSQDRVGKKINEFGKDARLG